MWLLFAQVFEWQKKILRQRVPRPPLPGIALLGFADPRSAAGQVCLVKQCHVMATLVHKDVIGHADKLHVFYLNSRFLQCFALEAIDRFFAELQVTAWRTPRTRAMCAATQA